MAALNKNTITFKHITTISPELEIIKNLFNEYAHELNENLCFQSFTDELNNPLTKYGLPTGDLILAYYNNEAVGCVALTDISNNLIFNQTKNKTQRTNNKVCEMKRLYVKPQFRKYKIGETLVAEIISSAKKLNYNLMKLDTLERLVPAIQLYKKFGFTITNAYYKNPLPHVVYMQLSLKWINFYSLFFLKLISKIY